MGKGIRHQLVPRSISRSSSLRETKVIILAEETYQLPEDILSTIANYVTWEQRFALPNEYSQDASELYVRLVQAILDQLTKNDESDFKALIIKCSRQVMSNGHDHLASRYVRRRMVSRLISLLINFDPLKEILQDPLVVGITVSGRSYFRVHNNNGSISTLNWFVSDEESKLLKMVLSKLLQGGKPDILLSNDLYASISSLRSSDYHKGSIVVAPMRSRKKSMLDLIKAKVLSPQLARNVSKSMLNSGKGFLISGGLDSGKSGLLSALISSVSSNAVPLIIADNEELKSCHPHAEILSHDEITSSLSHSTSRFIEDSIFRIGAQFLFVDDLNPSLYLFLLRMRLVYDIPIVATIPSINPKHYLKYLLEDVRQLKNLGGDVDETDVSHLIDAFPYVMALSKENDLRGVSCIYESTSAGKNFHLVPVIKRQIQGAGVSWQLTEVASSDSLVSIGFGM